MTLDYAECYTETSLRVGLESSAGGSASSRKHLDRSLNGDRGIYFHIKKDDFFILHLFC